MSGLISSLKKVAQDLNALQAPWSLVGALAVGVHVEPRSTRDVDVAVAVREKRDQEALITNLLSLGYANRQVLMQLEPTCPLGDRLELRSPPGFPLAVDLLFCSSGIEPEIVAAAVQIEIFPGLLVPVACPGHLIAMKALSQNDSDRQRDASDLHQLLVQASPADIIIARAAAALIEARGFARGKDVQRELTVALNKWAPALVEVR